MANSGISKKQNILEVSITRYLYPPGSQVPHGSYLMGIGILLIGIVPLLIKGLEINNGAAQYISAFKKSEII